MEAQATNQLNQILEMIGPHGVFAIIGSIILIRAIRALWYFEKQKSFITMFVVSGLIGAGSVYFATDLQGAKHILGGAFMTMIAVPIAYELLKWSLAFIYEKYPSRVLVALFFFLSPKPLKKKGGEIVPESSDLTAFFDKARVDKKHDR